MPLCRTPVHPYDGLMHGGTYGSQMPLDFATNSRGTTFAYRVCSSRARGELMHNY